MAVTIAYFALLALVGIGRLVELVISRRNQLRLEQQGIRRIPEPHFRWLVVLHAGVLVASAAEVVLLHRPLIPALAIVMGAIFVFSNILRWWVIGALGQLWAVKVMDSSSI